MSSRVSSFGSLGERVRTTPVAKQDRSAHVWVDGDRPGVLLSWQRTADGTWTALVAFVKEPGQLTVECLPSARVRPTQPVEASASGHDQTERVEPGGLSNAH